MMTSGARKILKYTIAGLVVSAGISLYVWRISLRPAVFELYAFDTPGSPAFFVRTEDDRRILINGGASSDIVRRVTELLPFYSRRIDEIAATDDDPKHITGLIEIVNRYDVGSAALPVAASSDPAYGVFLDLLAKKGIRPADLIDDDYIGGTSLRMVDQKRAIFTLSIAGQTILLAPFNPNTLSKKIIETTRPEYVIYSVAPSAKPANKEKSNALIGIMDDHRFNIRSNKGVRVVVDKKAPRGADLKIEQIY